MGILEIVLLAAGAVVFIGSFCIPVKQEKLKEESNKLAAKEVKALLAEELEYVRSRLIELSEEEMQEQIKKSERSMERISNEKIMAVGEYSDTVLNEIHKNHEEVVFLYDMLKNKKESLAESYDKTDQNLQNLLQQVKDSEITVQENLEALFQKQQEIEDWQAEAVSRIVAAQEGLEAQQEEALLRIGKAQQELEKQQGEAASRIAIAKKELEAQQGEATSRIAAAQKGLEAQQEEAALRIAAAKKELEVQQGEAASRIAAAQKELAAQQGEAVLRIEKARKELEARQEEQKMLDRASIIKEAEKENGFQPFSPERVEVFPKKKVVRRATKREFEIPESESRAVRNQSGMPENGRKGTSFGAEEEDIMLMLPDFAEKKAINSNERILELHKAGKSNMAIARELGLGLGEVKLVIDLYEGLW